MSERLTVYEKPACTTCKRLAALLTERGVAFVGLDDPGRSDDEL